MAADDDPDGRAPDGGGRRERRGRDRSVPPSGSDKDESKRNDDRGRSRSRSRTGRPPVADRSRSPVMRRHRPEDEHDADDGGAAAAESRHGRLRWRHPDSWDGQFTASGLGDSIAASIQAEFRSIGRLRGYNMEGDQSASTHVDDKSFRTTDQMHSEMRAIAATPALMPISNAYGTASNPRSVRFSTEQPHCGYCTFFLSKLGLPLTAPTAGLFNLARNCDYPLPGPLISNLAFLAHVCGISVPALMTKLNEIYVNTGEAPAATFQVNATVLKHIWRQVFAILNSMLPKLG